MKRLLSILTLALFALGVAHSETQQAADGSRTLMKINGQAFTEAHFLAFSVQHGGAKDLQTENAQVALLNKLANTVMVAQAAEKAKLDEHPQVKAAIEMARIQVLAEVQVTSYLASTPITEAEIKAAYDHRYSPENLLEFKASHILVNEEQAAADIIKALAAGQDFATLAREKSTDASKDKGGDLGWFGRKQVVKEFGDALVTLEPGQYTQQPVKSPFGWHVILLEEKRTQQAPALEEVKEQLANGLRQGRLTAYMGQLREETKIEVNAPEAAADPAPAPAPAKDK